MIESQEEIEFIEKINCNFPYQDKELCIQLIKESAAISDNAIFTVVEELCRIPPMNRSIASHEYLLELLEITAKEINHPLKEMVLNTARVMIVEKVISVDEAIENMKIIRDYPGQWGALSIMYFSCDDTEGIGGKLEYTFDSIRDEWNSTSTPSTSQ